MRVEYIFAVDVNTGEVSLLDDLDGDLVGLYNAKSDTIPFKPDHLLASDFRGMALVVWREALESNFSSDKVLH